MEIMSTAIKTVYGFWTDGEKLEKGKAVVRVTSDRRGETLSVEANGMMISVAFEDVMRIVEKARKGRQ